MMPAENIEPRDLAARLPTPRGKLRFDAPLGARTWLRLGGAADAVFNPADEDDLAGFLSATPADIPVTVIGAGSNLLVRDGGVRGVVIRLTGALARISTDGLTRAAARSTSRSLWRRRKMASAASLSYPACLAPSAVRCG